MSPSCIAPPTFETGLGQGFDDQGEEAAQFYTSVFKNSRITGVQRYSDAGPRPEGTVMTVDIAALERAYAGAGA
jgi:predicted 3-demethylubiquinone-9 3-methyltransferase (glyoxalase superfamily)